MSAPPAQDLALLGTEQHATDRAAIDLLPTRDLVAAMNVEDALVAARVRDAGDDIAAAVDLVAARMRRGGRLVYIGAGTAGGGRVGMLVYPFRMERRATRNRPDDEIRGQLRYGSESSWGDEHPIGHDIAGVDVTLLLGVHLDSGVFVGLQPGLYDPLPMGISFYAKLSQLEQAATDSWHVWEKNTHPGSRRVTPRGPSGLETIVAFTPDRLLDYVEFERRSTDLGLDPPLRYAAATSAAGAVTADDGSPVPHSLERDFELSSRDILEIISTRNRLQVAVRGGVAEHHLERVLRADPRVATVVRLDQDALHDFDVTLTDGRQFRVECKNASPEPYADGAFKVEVQKTRASKGDPASRFYRADQFDVVAACLYSATRAWTFRFRRTGELAGHRAYTDRLAPMQRVDDTWRTEIGDLP